MTSESEYVLLTHSVLYIIVLTQLAQLPALGQLAPHKKFSVADGSG